MSRAALFICFFIFFFSFVPTSSAQTSCPTTSSNTYKTLSILGQPTDRQAHLHADLNISLRDWSPEKASLGFVEVGGDTDAKAPQLVGFLERKPDEYPTMVNTYQINHWDWHINKPAKADDTWGATLVGFQTTPGESIFVPSSGYDIGSGYEVMVLYADTDSITIKYTREDNVVNGYAIHVEKFCVDPNLLKLYQQMNQAGRGQLPALKAGEVMGTAAGSETILAIRDTGRFMDPRSRKDWWSSAQLSPTPPPCKKSFLSQITNYITGIWSQISEREVPETLTKVNDSHLPMREHDSILGADDCPDEAIDETAQTIHEYHIGDSNNTSKTTSSAITSFFQDLIAWLGFSNTAIVQEGNKAAKDTLAAKVPKDVETGLLLRSAQSNTLGVSENQDVLALTSNGVIDTAMRDVMDWRMCAGLPAGVCTDDGKLNIAKDSAPSGPSGPTSPGGPGGPSSGWDGNSVGSCTPLERGPCDWKYLSKTYFGQNEIRAKNASMICNAESGGDPFALNDRCDPIKWPNPADRSKDFSVGMFQVNAIYHCSNAQPLVTDNPPTCRFGNRPALNACVAKWKTPSGNITEMMRISSDGTNWNPWATAKNCGLRKDTFAPEPPSSSPGALTYYSQRDPQYGSTSFDNCDIKTGGCGPTTVAMILSSVLRNKTYTPNKVVQDYYQNQPSCISTMTQAMSILMKHGFGKDTNGQFTRMAQLFYSADPQPLSPFMKREIKQYIDGGSIVIATATINDIGHYFWITDIQGDSVKVMDPWYQFDPNTQKPYAMPMDQSQIPYQVLYQSIRTIGKPW